MFSWLQFRGRLLGPISVTVEEDRFMAVLTYGSAPVAIDSRQRQRTLPEVSAEAMLKNTLQFCIAAAVLAAVCMVHHLRVNFRSQVTTLKPFCHLRCLDMLWI